VRYPFVLFDLDGTLIDSAQDLVASVQHALRSVDRRDTPDAADILALVGNPLEAFLPALGYPAGPEEARLFADTYRAHYAEHFNDHTTLYPGVAEMLTALKDGGARLALVTTKHQAQADFTARECGLLRWFDHVHGWREDRKHKPDPQPVLMALAELGGEPGRALMVGDSELDIGSGRSAGAATCAVTWGFRPAWLLKEYRPDFLVGAARDIPDIVFATD
jgi:pyrophosphatase PpaX